MKNLAINPININERNYFFVYINCVNKKYLVHLQTD